jgi:divinyl chlorophyllide a 8-vinyl-reductase
MAGRAEMTHSAPRHRVLLLGATGTIGQATARALVAAGHDTVCLVRPHAGPGGRLAEPDIRARLPGAELRFGDATDPASLRADAIRGERFDALISCLASRTGAPADAWAIDHRAFLAALAAAQDAGIGHVVLLSALCVQQPSLPFQQAKRAAEAALAASGLHWTVVRPTAFMKSLSGQLDRVRAGKPYLLVGDGRLTATKPIGDDDLGTYLATCLTDPERWNGILPIGGPGPAQTPREQGEALFALLGMRPHFRRVPLALLDALVAGLSGLGSVSPALAAKADLARIGRHYATHPMLVLDPGTGLPSDAATPAFGTERLIDYQARLLAGELRLERGDHAVF